MRALRTRAEQNSRRSRCPRRPRWRWRQLRERGFTAEQVAAMLDRALVRPVFTAHPSEARRRTILEKLDAIATQLDRLEYCQLLPSERAEAISAITAEVETFWFTDIVRDERPTVLDEMRHGLGLVSDTLFDIVPRVYRESGRAAGPHVSRRSAGGTAAAAIWLVDRRRPRRQPACHARRHAARRCACSRKRSCDTIWARSRNWAGG